MNQQLAAVLDRTPPQNVELEMCVLGAIMLEPREAYEIAAEWLREGSFYLDGHGLLFRLMGELHSRGIPPDAVALIDELRARNLLGRVGGTGVVMGMLNSVPTAANIEHHARKVADKAQLRELIRTCTVIVEQAYRQDQDASELTQQAALAVGNLADSQPADMLTVAEAAQSYMHDLSERADEAKRLRAEGKSPRALRGIETHYQDLDRLFSGLRDEELTIIAARPGAGKSTLALNIFTNIVIHGGLPVALFNLEMSAEQITERMLAAGSMYTDPQTSVLCGVSSIALTRAEMSQREWLVLTKSYERLTTATGYLCTHGTLSIEQLRAHAGTLVRKGVRLIIVDYLQLMVPDNSRDDVREITRVSRGLKKIAKDYKIPVIALSQLSRNSVSGNSDIPRRPGLHDLRGSGSIEQDADNVMFIHDPKPKDSVPGQLKPVTLIIAKNRNGPTCDIELNWKQDIYRFMNTATPAQQSQWQAAPERRKVELTRTGESK